MQQTAIRHRGRLFWWGGGSLALAGAVLLLTGVRAPAPRPPYARYLSRPLLDGTRYTFLYPAALGQVDVYCASLPDRRGWRHQVQDLLITGRVGPVQALLRRSSLLRGLFHGDDVEQVRLDLTDDPAQPSPSPPGVPVGSGDPRYSRSESVNALMCEHYVTVTDRRSGVRFCLSHYGWGGDRASFLRDDPTIASSFRVLPRGVSVPAR